MPTLFSRRYMRGKPKRTERAVGASILVLLGLIVGLFVLTGGVFENVVGRVGVLNKAKAVIGISERPLFLADPENMPPPAPPHQVQAARALLPELPEPWQRVSVTAEQVPPWSGPSAARWAGSWSHEARKALWEPLFSMYGATWTYRGEYELDGRKLYVTITDAGTPESAFGLWQAVRGQTPKEARRLAVGRAAWINDASGCGAFWAGRYHTDVFGYPWLKDSDLEAVVRAIASVQIVYGGPFWAESVLPVDGRVQDSLAYVPRDPLGLGELADCWLAEYPGGVTLGVMRPDSPDAVLNALRQRFQAAPPVAESVQPAIPAVADAYSGGEELLSAAGAESGGAGQSGELAEALGPPAAVGKLGDRVVAAFAAGPYLFIAAGSDPAVIQPLAISTRDHWSGYAAGRSGPDTGGAPVPHLATTGRARFAEVPGGDILTPTRIERYTDNLYEKINGREGAFRAYHFVELRFGQYLDSRTRQVYDVYIYDMGEPLNAMGIHLSERSDAGDALPVGRDGYLSGSSAYFWKGRYFINVLGPVEGGEAAGEVSKRIAAAIAGTIADTGSELWAEELLPAEDRVPDSLVYRATSGLGYDFLEGLFLADYVTGEQKYQVFLVRASGPAEAAELFEKYAEGTARYDKIVSREAFDGGETLVGESLDIYSVAFHRGVYLGGVVECEDLDLAVERAAMLRERLPVDGGGGAPAGVMKPQAVKTEAPASPAEEGGDYGY